jgi:hypothetical protein
MPASRPSRSSTQSPTYLKFYAGEIAWREDMRRDDNGTQYQRAGINALGHRKAGYAAATDNGLRRSMCVDREIVSGRYKVPYGPAAI